MIELTNVNKQYPEHTGGTYALRDCSLRIESGDFIAIVGTSGSGKTTLLNLLGCLDDEYTGQVKINGLDLKTLSDQDRAAFRNQEIGFIFQEFHLLDHLTVIENILLPTYFNQNQHTVTQAHVSHLVETLGIDAKLHQRTAHLSGGQRQRVAIARALVQSPRLLLCDEPTGSLDEVTGHQLLDMLSELNAHGYTIVMITHDENVARVAKRQISITDGVITERGGA
jgi:putative ABC transport system ATP-binding protein